MLLFTVPILTLIILYLLKLSLNIHHTCMFGQFSININTYLVIIWNNNPSEPKMFTLVHRKRRRGDKTKVCMSTTRMWDDHLKVKFFLLLKFEAHTIL